MKANLLPEPQREMQCAVISLDNSGERKSSTNHKFWGIEKTTTAVVDLESCSLNTFSTFLPIRQWTERASIVVVQL